MISWQHVISWGCILGYAGGMYWLSRQTLVIYCGFGIILICYLLTAWNAVQNSIQVRGIPQVHESQIPNSSITLAKFADDALAALHNELTTKVFTFETTSPVLLKTTNADDLISTILISIEDAFTGVASLSIGDSADHARFMASTEIDSGTPGLYQVSPNYRYAAVTSIYLYLACMGTDAGSGRVSLD